MLIKVCGLKQPENIKNLSNLTLDFLGFIFYAPSKRFVGNDFTIPPKIHQKKIGVFVNESLEKINSLITKHQLDGIQLHGSETPEFIQKIKTMKPSLLIFKAFGIDENFNFDALTAYKVDYFLFDTKTPLHGGSGKKFNWNQLIKYSLDTPFFISGGIQESDAEEILLFSHKKFAGIDINSGFEKTPGIKDHIKIEEFCAKIKSIS